MFEGFSPLLFARTIVEGIIIILAVYKFSNTTIDVRKLFVWGSFLGLITYFVRLLPINFGVHTILLVLIIMFIATQMCHINLNKAVASSLFFVIILFICEWIYIYSYEMFFEISPTVFQENSLLGISLTLPSLFTAILLVYLITFIKKNAFKRGN